MRRAPVLAALLVPAVLLGSCGDGDHAAERARAVVPLRLDRVHVGDDERGGEVFLPRGVARPPVVLFIHGLFATSPEMYGGWIRHLVDEGNAVIYPTYQHTFTPPAAFLANIVAAVRAALTRVPLQRRTL